MPELGPASKEVHSKSEENNTSSKEPEHQALNEQKQPNVSHSNQRENFVCVDVNGLMYSFTVDANCIKDGGKLLPDDPSLHVNLNTMAIKKDLVLFGDIDGNVIKWDVKAKSSKVYKNTLKGEVKKLKFAPGKENLLLLVFFYDSIDVVEAGSFENVSSFNKAASNLTTALSGGVGGSGARAKIVDCNWCSSDKIVVLFADSVIKVFDLNFKQQSNLINCIPSLSRFTENQASSKTMDSDEIQAFKNYFLEAIDAGGHAFAEDAHEIGLEYFANSKSSQLILRDLLKNLNAEFLALLRGLMIVNETDWKRRVLGKVAAFYLFSSYFNFGSFETKFWNVFSNTLDMKCGLENQYSYLAKAVDFRKMEYQKMKFHKEKQHLIAAKNSELVQDLILCNELDLVFNFLTETEPQSERYLDNYMKYVICSCSLLIETKNMLTIK